MRSISNFITSLSNICNLLATISNFLKSIIPFFVISVGFMLLVSGCSLFDSHYKEPHFNINQNFSTTHNLGSKVVNIDTKTLWWQKFHDAKLNKLVDLALKQNSDIQIAIGRINQAKANLSQVNMSYIPTIGLGGGALYGGSDTGINSPNPQMSSMGGSSNMNFFALGLVPSYSINILALAKQRDIAKLNIDMAKAMAYATRLAIINQVTVGYLSLEALRDESDQYDQLIHDLKTQMHLVSTDYINGHSDLSMVNQVKIQLEQANIKLPDIQNNIRTTQNALDLLINKNPGYTIITGNFESISHDNLIAPNIHSNVMNNRPDILYAQNQLRAAGANIDLAKSRFFPQIDITTPAGLFSTQVANLFSANGNFWNTQVIANMPILNLGLNSLIKEKKAEYYVAYYNYVKVIEKAFVDVDDAFALYEKTTDTNKLTNELLGNTHNLYDISSKNYQYGYSSYYSMLTNKVSLDQVMLQVTNAKFEKLQAISYIYQSLGAGYDYHYSESAVDTIVR